jgi:hypothetical protein
MHPCRQGISVAEMHQTRNTKAWTLPKQDQPAGLREPEGTLKRLFLLKKTTKDCCRNSEIIYVLTGEETMCVCTMCIKVGRVLLPARKKPRWGSFGINILLKKVLYRPSRGRRLFLKVRGLLPCSIIACDFSFSSIISQRLYLAQSL